MKLLSERTERACEAFDLARSKKELARVYKLTDPLWQELRLNPDHAVLPLIEKLDRHFKRKKEMLRDSAA